MTDHTIEAALNTILRRLDELERGQELVYEQIEALLNLHALLAPLNAPLPPMRKWAIAPDFAVLLYNLLLEHQPATVVELGGGVSTVITGYYFAQHEAGSIYAFDHQQAFVDLTRKHLEAHQMIDVAQVTHAPLVDVVINGQMWQWYDPLAFDRVEAIDFLTVDGPPQQDNPQALARYPALPVLFKKLQPGAIILMDDTHRADETRIIERWLDEFDIVKLRSVDNEKGAVVLQKQ